MIKRLAFLLTLILGLATYSLPAAAGTNVYTGHITSTFLSSAGNLAFRITLDVDMTANCPGNFAYTNANSDNYQAWVAALLTAYSAGKTVNVSVATGQSGYCQIMEFGMR